jgi:outer membrane protein TolC
MKTTMKFNGLILLALLGLAGPAQAQLSLNAALDSALQLRLGLVIARNGAEMARLQNNPGMAGMLPFVSLGSGLGLSGTSIDQQFSNGTVIRRDGVQVNTANANLGASWTLFDGMRMFVMRDRLQVLENLGEQGVFAETVRIATSTRLAFHGAAREQAVLAYMQKQLALSKALADLAEQRSLTGTVAAVEAMRAQTAAQAWDAQVAQQEGRLREAREALAFEMTVPAERLPAALEYDTLLPPQTPVETWTAAMERNPDVQVSKMNFELAALQVREWESQRWPQLRTGTGFNYNTNRNSDGFFLVNQSYGLNSSLTLSWNLFNGGNVRNQVKVAGIQRDNAALAGAELRRTLESSIRQAWIRLETAKQVYRQTAQALATAVLAREVTEARYRAGAALLLELNEALRSENELQLALADALLRIRIAETELGALTGVQ